MICQVLKEIEAPCFNTKEHQKKINSKYSCNHLVLKLKKMLQKIKKAQETILKVESSQEETQA